MIRIALCKTNPTAGNCWKSLLIDQYIADELVYNEMEQKLTLEKMQTEVNK